MTRSGTSRGTVIRWDDAERAGLVEAPDLPGDCWVDASVVSGPRGGTLRAGQVVDVDWTEPGVEGAAFRATRVVPREDLQATLGA
jgi:cold shock CspA family protein